MKVLYFAWLRAKTGVGEETVEAGGIGDVTALIAALSQRSPGHAEAFANLKVVRVAVNQDYVGFDHPLKPGDEIAFFPPVTGG
ncbi:MAG: molybdopterin converting factor subunit 1 [Magnetospirillum sp.]|nr:molybdopterin converting factor subunit 1 [Magnetospirillum sp.]